MSETPILDTSTLTAPKVEESTVGADNAREETKIAGLKAAAVEAAKAYWAKEAALKREEGSLYDSAHFTNSPEWQARKSALEAYAAAAGEDELSAWFKLSAEAGHPISRLGDQPIREF